LDLPSLGAARRSVFGWLILSGLLLARVDSAAPAVAEILDNAIERGVTAAPSR
jgi:hypothetical protein